MTKRIILKGIHVARIDEELCKEYEKVCGEPLTKNILRILETTFKTRIESIDDIKEISEKLKKLHYDSIGEWLKGYMRLRITADVGEQVCPFKCKDCAKFNCGLDHPVMSDGNSTWNYCPEWQCGVDGENNKGIAGCFTVK